jgi:hypothetical protein
MDSLKNEPPYSTPEDESENRPIGEFIEHAIRQHERLKFWQGVQDDFARLRSDPVAWRDYQDEVAAWDTLAGDGLDNEEPYYGSD